MHSSKPYGILAAAFILMFAALPAVASARTMTSGMSGTDVKALQTQLSAKGYLAAAPNGHFGPATLAAVRKFQCAQNIVCSGSSYGIAGPRTQAALPGAGAAAADPSIGPSTAKAPAGVTPGSDPSQQGVLTGKSIGSKWTGPLEFSGWMPDWRAQQSVDDVTPHLGQLTSVMPFGYKVNAAGQVVGDFVPTIEPWKSFIADAKAKGVRVVPSVVMGDGPTIHAVLSDTQKRIALEDDYFVSHKLFPNVDFYSGIILQAIGFPTSMFTVLFAVARTVGWVAQWKEMIEDPTQRIGRPRQLYTGYGERPFLPIDKRK